MIVYLIVRPPEFLDDVRLRELEMTAAEARLASLDYSLCPHCDYEVQIGLPALSELHAQAQGALLLVLEADRPGVAHLPVLRGRDERPDAVVHSRRRRRQTTDQATVAAEVAQPEPAEAGTGETVTPSASLTH